MGEETKKNSEQSKASTISAIKLGNVQDIFVRFFVDFPKECLNRLKVYVTQRKNYVHEEDGWGGGSETETISHLPAAHIPDQHDMLYKDDMGIIRRLRPDEDEETLDVRKIKRYKPQGTSASHILMYIAVFLVFMGGVTYYLGQNSFHDDERALPLKRAEKAEILPVGARKLAKPLLGKDPVQTYQDNQTSSQRDTSGLENDQEFDFSPLEDHKIERLPVLPKKYAKANSEAEELRLLWDSSVSSADIKSDLNIQNYDSLSIDELKKISANYLPTWQKYAVDTAPTDGKSIYAIIVNYDPSKTPPSLLPDAQLTLAIEGYRPEAQTLINQLKQKGYEFLLQLPLEPDEKSSDAPGVRPLQAKSSFEALETRIKWHNTNVEGHIGFKNMNDSDIIYDHGRMNWTMNLLRENGLTFLEVIKDPDAFGAVAHASAKAAGIPTRKADIIRSIDIDFPEFIQRVARFGHGVTVIDGTVENLEILQKVLTRLQAENTSLQLVPLSRIYAYDLVKAEMQRF
ncbi:MAG: divergent polysaccharide deacetylase family protein [Pseudomonadota bacterium]